MIIMSRIGKKIIKIPQGVNINFEPKGRTLTVSGPHGTLARNMRPEVDMNVEEDTLTFVINNDDIFSRSLWGTYASHAINMIEGVTNRFEKKMIVEGVGYTVEVSGNTLTLKVGFSHPVNVLIPEDLEVSTEKNTIIVKGADKEKVGSFCAQVRSIKKPEPYKGKGIRYENEVVKRKQGKKSA